MRPATSLPTSPATLRAVVDALSDTRLAALVVALARTGDAAVTPGEAPAEPATRRRYARHTDKPRRSRPPAARAGRRGRPRQDHPDAAAVSEAKRIARRARAVVYQRAKRAAAKAAMAAAEHGNGNGATNGQSVALRPATTPAELWADAARISPKTPWRAVAREFGVNEARTLDAYRNRSLPPGITSIAIERFLELPAP